MTEALTLSVLEGIAAELKKQMSDRVMAPYGICQFIPMRHTGKSCISYQIKYDLQKEFCRLIELGIVPMPKRATKDFDEIILPQYWFDVVDGVFALSNDEFMKKAFKIEDFLERKELYRKWYEPRLKFIQYLIGERKAEAFLTKEFLEELKNKLQEFKDNGNYHGLCNGVSLVLVDKGYTQRTQSLSETIPRLGFSISVLTSILKQKYIEYSGFETLHDFWFPIHGVQKDAIEYVWGKSPLRDDERVAFTEDWYKVRFEFIDHLIQKQ